MHLDFGRRPERGTPTRAMPGSTSTLFAAPRISADTSYSSIRVLDCGCGPGAVTIGLAQAVEHGEAVGVAPDAAPGRLQTD
jgi:ubiquinone/menaquinone biosynthesis C-methylase UbiE